jgi:peptide/nickel transport system substrate-binding protein
MRNKIIVLVVAFTLIGGFAFASGKKEIKPGAAVTGEPQYGGTLTIAHSYITTAGDPPNPDIAAGHHSPTRWLKPIQENPIIGDIEKYGPRGTGEYPFNTVFIPMRYIKGHLIESWEITPERTVWKVRPGIHWAADNVDWMDNRELVAEDVVQDLIYFRKAPGGSSFDKMAGDIYAKDKYTLVIETPPGYNILMIYLIGYEDRAIVAPPEMIKAGPDQWENQVGTGPFMFKEYVVGSYMSFEKNPNYWKTTTIDGKVYKMPFIDELIIPIIPDVSTQMAALRTAKIDLHDQPPVAYWKDLDKTAPDLLSATGSGWGAQVTLDTTKPPFDNVKVRQALMIGTDLKAFGDRHGIGPRPIYWYPIIPPYVPFEKLPEETQLLFKYNPDLARKMLDEAGVPKGFKMDYYTTAELEWEERAVLLKDQWSKIGIDLNIIPLENAICRSHLDGRTYNHSITCNMAAANPTELFRYAPGKVFDFAKWQNEKFSQLADNGSAELDTAKRDQLIAEASVIFLTEVPYIPLDIDPIKWYWWPWIKNYYGEWNIEDGGLYPIVPYIWLDKNLKKSMGY